MAGHHELEYDQDESGNEEGLDAVTDQDDKHLVEKSLIDTFETGNNCQGAKLQFLITGAIDHRKFPPDDILVIGLT